MAKSYLLGMYEKAVPAELTWLERLQVARESGFDFLEISIDETPQRLERLSWSPEQRRELVRLAGAEQLPIRSMCLSAHRKYPFGSHDAEVRKESEAIMLKALNLACDLGVRIVQLAGYDVYYEEGDADTQAWFEEGLHKACELAAKRGVLLGFETMETPFMDTVGKAMHYVQRMNSPYLGVYPDMGNLTNASFLYGVSVADDIATGRGHIFAAHCKETVAGVYRDMIFGTGTTDYEGALDELVSQGVRRFVAEFWYKGNPEWREETKEAAQFVRAHIEAALERTGQAIVE